ncbi:MAG: lasso peptide biosynthesis B2 protein, partial [Vicinamibacterales bacterium]
MNATRRDVVATLLLMLIVDLTIASGGFPRIHRLVRRIIVQRRRAIADETRLVEAVNDAVNRAAVWYPRVQLCVPRSVVATWLLRRRGLPAVFVIGIRKIPFYAHAWVEVDGRVVNDAANVQKLYPAIDYLAPAGAER